MGKCKLVSSGSGEKGVAKFCEHGNETRVP
jgi:hypothetical protein